MRNVPRVPKELLVIRFRLSALLVAAAALVNARAFGGCSTYFVRRNRPRRQRSGR